MFLCGTSDKVWNFASGSAVAAGQQKRRLRFNMLFRGTSQLEAEGQLGLAVFGSRLPDSTFLLSSMLGSVPPAFLH